MGDPEMARQGRLPTDGPGAYERCAEDLGGTEIEILRWEVVSDAVVGVRVQLLMPRGKSAASAC